MVKHPRKQGRFRSKTMVIWGSRLICVISWVMLDSWVSNLVERNLLSLKRLDICIYLSHFLQQKKREKNCKMFWTSLSSCPLVAVVLCFFARLLPHPTGKVGFCWLEISATDMRFWCPPFQPTPLRFFWISCSSAQHDDSAKCGKSCRWKWWKCSKIVVRFGDFCLP